MNLVLTNNGLRLETEFLITTCVSGLQVYEVIRIIDGVALFLEDHFNRLKRSMKIQGLTLEMDFQEFKLNIAELVMQNHKMVGNIKFSYSVADDNIHWAFGFIPNSYPTSEEYETGVKIDMLFAVRQNPNAKVVQAAIRNEANQLISDRDLYEVLLVDQNEMITEGSRSNVFFVKGDRFYTAPASMVLVGITRQKVIECLNDLNLQVIEQAVSKEQLGSFDAAFLTGTSPKVLSIKSIGEKVFDVGNSAILRLMESYDKMIWDYIRNEKS